MIKINLTPLDELDNPYWYVPDVVTIAIAAVGCWLYLSSLVDDARFEIDDIVAETTQVQASYDNIAQDLEKFKNLENEVATLQGKIAALKQITVSKITKYESVVLLEHLQTLKPDGLWYEDIKIDSNQKTIEAFGRSFDPILVAEYMSLLEDTKTQKVDPVDLRTQLYFSDIKIQSIENNSEGTVAADDVLNVEKFPKYKLMISYKIREARIENAELN